MLRFVQASATATPASSGAKTNTSSRRLLFRLAAIGVGLLAGLLIAEGTVRLLGIGPPKVVTKRQLIQLDGDPVVYYHCYPDNPHGELSPLPDISTGEWLLHDYTFERNQIPLSKVEETPWCVEYRHSTKGIRDREYSAQTPPGLIRLAVVGDSFVFGEGVAEQATLPRQLQEQLGNRFECINGGQVGANAEQELLILDAIVREADCSRAILVLIPNDIPLTPSLARQQQYINDFILIRDKYLERAWHRNLFLGNLRILDLLASPWAMSKIRRDTVKWYLDCYSPRRNGTNLQWLQDQFNALAERQDCRTVVVLYPLLERLSEGYPLQSVHEKLGKMLTQAGLPFLDLTPAFRGKETSQLWVHATDHHPNGAAHALAARAIADWLREDQKAFLTGADVEREAASP